jgi:hypothetical protein
MAQVSRFFVFFAFSPVIFCTTITSLVSGSCDAVPFSPFVDAGQNLASGSCSTGSGFTESGAFGSASGAGSATTGSFQVSARSFGDATVYSEVTLSQQVVATGGSGSGFANFFVCYVGEFTGIESAPEATVQLGGTSLGWELEGQGGGCSGQFSTAIAVAVTFGDPFPENVFISASSDTGPGFSDSGSANGSLTYQLVSITDSSGDIIDGSELIVLPEPGTGWLGLCVAGAIALTALANAYFPCRVSLAAFAISGSGSAANFKNNGNASILPACGKARRS